MQVKSISLQNFGSYKSLEMNLENRGLVLIQGANGAGKSTIFDAVYWILFGITAKGGKSDEIRSWNGGAAYGQLIDISGNTITRVRGSSNDLYLGRKESPERGKDLSDTQKIINARFGLDSHLYQYGAYYHEFSEPAQFFTTAAKGRRDLCERLVDLSFATKLQEKASLKSKELESSLSKIDSEIRDLNIEHNTLQRLHEQDKIRITKWRGDHERQIKDAETAYERFEKNRRRVIEKRCQSCGTTLTAPKEVFDDSANPYAARLAELQTEECPFAESEEDNSSERTSVMRRINELVRRRDGLFGEQGDLTQLTEIFKDFRGALVRNTIEFVERMTNDVLMKYFDGELALSLSIIGADKLDVSIMKDGNAAAYTQLSKGQRQLLKLSFSVAVMKAISNHHGVKFNTLWFDESLDGLSDTMKLKAFRLFEQLSTEYDSVFVIDHSEALKAHFPNIINVTNNTGYSEICQS